MARSIGKLSAIAVTRIAKEGLHADGGGLYLQVTASGSKSWLYRYMLNGRARAMGLGPLHVISLAEARVKAAECRRLRFDGIDPIEARQAHRNQAKLDASKAISFDECAEGFIEAHKSGWRNAKHRDQWCNTLKTYASPIFGSSPVQTVDLVLVLKCVEPIWKIKPETASRLRGRIESILDWATVRGYRTGDNPARWRGHLDKLLPARAKVRRIEHHPALSYSELPAFLGLLRGQEAISALALEFTILTAARTGEVIGAKWGEFDLPEKLWTVPDQRMKAGWEHRVPLSDAILSILEKLDQARDGEFVFAGGKKGKPLSNMAMLALLRRMQRADLTVHGFRSTFRDWAAEQTNSPREVVEMALAHTIGDKVEAAYRRGDLFEKRRQLMNEWTTYCYAPANPISTSVVDGLK